MHEWTKQVKYVEKILNLFQYQGDVLIDEVDSLLDSRNQLNYSFGNPETLDRLTLTSIIELYDFFDQVNINSIIGIDNDQVSNTLTNIVSNNHLVQTVDQWEKLNELLIEQLASSPNSPLYPILVQLSKHRDLHKDTAQNLIVDYLSNKSDKIMEMKISNHHMKLLALVPSVFLSEALKKSDSNRTRAIIDVGATFKGVSNIQVAKEIGIVCRGWSEAFFS